jgi:hypothetical protein
MAVTPPANTMVMTLRGAAGGRAQRSGGAVGGALRAPAAAAREARLAGPHGRTHISGKHHNRTNIMVPTSR